MLNATLRTKRAFSRTEEIFAPLRTMRASLMSASQKPSGSNVSRRLEAEKDLFEARPLRLDHAPDEAGREYALGHLGDDAVVAELAQRLWVRLGR
jgi:hypothetical protein